MNYELWKWEWELVDKGFQKEFSIPVIPLQRYACLRDCFHEIRWEPGKTYCLFKTEDKEVSFLSLSIQLSLLGGF